MPTISSFPFSQTIDATFVTNEKNVTAASNASAVYGATAGWNSQPGIIFTLSDLLPGSGGNNQYYCGLNGYTFDGALDASIVYLGFMVNFGTGFDISNNGYDQFGGKFVEFDGNPAPALDRNFFNMTAKAGGVGLTCQEDANTASGSDSTIFFLGNEQSPDYNDEWLWVLFYRNNSTHRAGYKIYQASGLLEAKEWDSPQHQHTSFTFTSSGTTVTAETAAGIPLEDAEVIVSGANESAYNGTFNMTVLADGKNHYDTPLHTGDGSTVTFAGTLPDTYIQSGSLTVRDNYGIGETLTDNGDGTLTGGSGGSGTINYNTGAYSVTFNTAPANGNPIHFTYTAHARFTYTALSTPSASPATGSPVFILNKTDENSATILGFMNRVGAQANTTYTVSHIQLDDAEIEPPAGFIDPRIIIGFPYEPVLSDADKTALSTIGVPGGTWTQGTVTHLPTGSGGGGNAYQYRVQWKVSGDPSDADGQRSIGLGDIVLSSGLGSIQDLWFRFVVRHGSALTAANVIENKLVLVSNNPTGDNLDRPILKQAAIDSTNGFRFEWNEDATLIPDTTAALRVGGTLPADRTGEDICVRVRVNISTGVMTYYFNYEDETSESFSYSDYPNNWYNALLSHTGGTATLNLGSDLFDVADIEIRYTDDDTYWNGSHTLTADNTDGTYNFSINASAPTNPSPVLYLYKTSAPGTLYEVTSATQVSGTATIVLAAGDVLNVSDVIRFKNPDAFEWQDGPFTIATDPGTGTYTFSIDPAAPSPENGKMQARMLKSKINSFFIGGFWNGVIVNDANANFVISDLKADISDPGLPTWFPGYSAGGGSLNRLSPPIAQDLAKDLALDATEV